MDQSLGGNTTAPACAFVASSPCNLQNLGCTVPVCDELGRASWVRGEHACGHARATGTSQLLSITRRETTHDVSGRTRGRTTLSRRGHVWSQLGEHTPVLPPSSSERENCDSDAGDARNRSGRRGAQGEPVTRLCSTPLNLSRCQNSASSAFRFYTADGPVV